MSGLSEKIDVLDLIIEVLREHERTLDGLIARLASEVDRLGTRGSEADVLRRFHEPL